MTEQKNVGIGNGLGPITEQKKNNQNDLHVLIDAIRQGDEKAFEIFYLGYSDSLLGFLTKFLCNKEDAKEVMQDSFVLLWESREKLDPQKSLKAYVSSMARNTAVNLIRSRSKLPESDIDLTRYDEKLVGCADEYLLEDETDILIKDTLRRMPPQRSKIFRLSREEGLSYSEIAERLDISLNTVKFHMKAALNDIRSTLSAVLVFFFFG